MQSGPIIQHASTVRGGRSRQLFIFAFLLPLLLLVPSGCERREAAHSQQEHRQVEVAVVAVEPRDVPVTFQYIAQVQSSRQVSIQARVNGFLDRRVYTEGAVVREGQTLFLMDQKPFKAKLDEAEAALARQRANHQVARQNLARVRPLTAEKVLSQKDLDEATGKFESTAAAVQQAEAAVDQAKLDLSYTVIASPVTGITSSALQPDGTYLSPANNQLTTVTVISPAYVNFSVSENDWLRYLGQVQKKLLVAPKEKRYTAEIVLADGSIYPYTGKVTFADPSFNAQTGTFLIRATVDNPDGLLRPNQYVHVRLKGAVRPNATLVPQRAVQQSSKGHFVWVADKGNKAEMRPVLTGEWYGNEWLISEGLHPGDLVVVDGILALRPGAPLRPRPLVGKEGAAANPAAQNDPAKSGP